MPERDERDAGGNWVGEDLVVEFLGVGDWEEEAVQAAEGGKGGGCYAFECDVRGQRTEFSGRKGWCRWCIWDWRFLRRVLRYRGCR